MHGVDLKLYVRGFFGSKSLSNETYQSTRSKPILSVFDLTPEALQHVVCNESVVEIYNQLIRRQVIHTDFDFRERAVKIALSAFGVKNFEQWAAFNLDSPTFTQLHADFITDTARFITTGKRDLPVGTWERMIGPGSNDPTSKATYDSSVMARLPQGYSILSEQKSMGNMHNVVAQWLSQSGGFSDMVVSLYTLFGEYNTR